jgi:hypothetical protein
MMMRYGVNTPKTAGNTTSWKKKSVCVILMELERISNDLEHANTVQEERRVSSGSSVKQF